MKKIIKTFLTFVLGGVIVLGAAGCGEPAAKKLALPEEEEFMQTTVWNDAMMTAYLKPYWYTREIYNETVVFVGEEGEASFMYTPIEVDSVRNYSLDKKYKEGVDYAIEGNKIRRLKGSAIPYWEPENYFLPQPNVSGVSIAADMNKVDFDLEGQRFLYYGETTTFTSKQIAVTYRHNEVFDGVVPAEQSEKLASVLSKIENGLPVNMMIYGDSVATGCNASGTIWGGNVAPYMPDAYQIVEQYIEKNYCAKIHLENQAVGGWKLIDCVGAYESKISGKNIDLMILRIGGNDGHTSEKDYINQMKLLLDLFFADYPQACVIIQTPELPNEQSTWTLNVDQIDRWTQTITSEYEKADRVAVADVQSFSKWLLARNKRSRDFLANNINHANDFMIRAYAQYILKTMFGNEYAEEMYELG